MSADCSFPGSSCNTCKEPRKKKKKVGLAENRAREGRKEDTDGGDANVWVRH